MENSTDWMMKIFTGVGLLKLGWGGLVIMTFYIHEKEKRFWEKRDAVRQNEIDKLEARLMAFEQSETVKNNMGIENNSNVLEKQLLELSQRFDELAKQLKYRNQDVAEKDRRISKLNSDNNSLRLQIEQHRNLKSVLTSFSMPNIGADSPRSLSRTG